MTKKKNTPAPVDNKTAEKKTSDKNKQEEQAPSRNVRPQIVGAAVGMFTGWIIANATLNLGWFNGSIARMTLLGGVIGGLIGGNEALADAGKRLTNKDDVTLNTIVALVGMAVIFGAILGLLYFANWLVVRWGIEDV